MNDTDAARLIEIARAAVGASAEAAVASRWVTRLDPGREPYLLVGITDDDHGWVAAVSGAGELMTRASDPDGASAWWVAVEEELVWSPGSWSRSALYPLRRIEGGFLDQAGERVPGVGPGPGG